jgi:hypothetical protein
VTKAQDRIMRLKRRANWLEARVSIGDSNARDLSRDKAELSALRWAVKILEEQFGEAPEPIRSPWQNSSPAGLTIDRPIAGPRANGSPRQWNCRE